LFRTSYFTSNYYIINQKKYESFYEIKLFIYANAKFRKKLRYHRDALNYHGTNINVLITHKL